MRKIIVLIILSMAIPGFGEELYYQDFSTGSWPTGYAFEGNWQIGNNWDGNDTPPAAIYNWTPQQTNFEHNMTTDYIDVGENESVLVQFDFALDFYDDDELNGLRISYHGGTDWVTVLDYAIGPDAGDVDVSRRTESFTADIESGADLQIRWTAYGDDSYAINGWIVDNIQVLTLPKLTSVTIESANEDPATATAGTNIWLNFTTDTEFLFDPYVQINGTACNIDNLGSTNWVAYYTVTELDPDGPLQFTIDFTDINGIDGKTVKETTNGSTVIVDNSDPPSFSVGTVTASGGTVADEIWNSTNTNVQMEINVPQDSAVIDFNYTLGNALSFDGVNDIVEIVSIGDYQVSNTLTVEAWVKPNSYSDYDGFLNYAMDNGATEAGFGFVYFATGWRFYIKTNSNTIEYSNMAEASAPVGQWTHLAATFDGTKVIIYRNGSAIDSADAMGNIEWMGAPDNFTLGNFSKDGTIGYFDGMIDEIRLWNVIRSEVQIKASKEISLNGDETGLIGYWPIDNGSGSAIADLSSNSNNGTINGATWITEDSPIYFQDPIYDTGVIVGSSFQLRGRVGLNVFEGFGLKDTITINDFNTGTMVVSGSESDFEAIANFAHDSTAQLSAYLFDVAGNFSEGDTSTTELVIDLIANSPDPVTISSNNNFSHLAKTGDIITITMAYDEDVETPEVTVDGNNADEETDLGSEQFSSTYTLGGAEADGSLNFILTTTDYLGNPGTHSGSTDGSTVVFDGTEPIVSPMTIISSNADPQWAKVGDTVRLDIGADEILFETDVTLAGATMTLYDTTESVYNGSSECSGGEIVTDNLKLWLDADDVDGDGITEGMNEDNLLGSEVVIWADKSGNGSDVSEVAGLGLPDLVQNQFNGNNSLMFSRSQEDVLVHDLGAGKWTANEYSLFIVFQMIGTPQNYDSFFSNGDNNNGDFFQITQLNGVFRFLSNGQIDFEPWDNELKLYGVLGSTTSTTTIVDGNEVNSSNMTNGRNFDKYKINWNRLNYQHSDSYIAEVLLYDRELNQGELTKTYKYLGNKYGKDFSKDTTVVHTKREMNITDPEGMIAINITHNDCAGNDGTPISETTDGSYVIFDRTAPTEFTVDTVISTGGNTIENAWNSTNTGLKVLIPVASDTTLKNGWVQVWVKIGMNAFEKLGTSSVILNGDLNTNKTIQFTAAQVEAITGFTEEDTISFKAIMSDRPGNETEGNESNFRLVIDQTPPVILSSHIESNNADTTKAKVEDIISITFEVDEDVQTPTMTIASGAGTVTDLGSFKWLATYIMLETDDEGVIAFTLDEIMDAHGNPVDGLTSTTDGSQVVFDRTKPVLDNVSANSWNTWDQSWAKLNDDGRVYSNTSEGLLTISGTFNSQPTTLYLYSGTEFDLNYTFTLVDPEGLFSIEIVYTDSAGNEGEPVTNTTNESFIIFDNTYPTDFTTGEISSAGGNVVDSVWNSTNSSVEVSIPIENDSTLNNGRVQVYAKVGSNSYEKIGNYEFIQSEEVGATKTISLPRDSIVALVGYAENDILSFKSHLFDIPGNETEGAESATILLIDETAPTIVSVSYESNYSDSSLATIGHEITLIFETDVEIQTPVVTISTNSATVTGLGSNQWQATYIMQDSDEDGIIIFQIDTLTDSRGNPAEGTSSTTDDTQVIFDKTQPTLNPVSVISNNPDLEWAKVGDSITISFSSDEGLMVTTGTIVTQAAIVTDLGGNSFTAKYEMTEADPEGEIEFEIIVTDLVGLNSDPVSETTDETSVIFDRTLPELDYVHIESSNINNTSIGISGNDVYLTFTPNEPLILDSMVVTISETPATVAESEGSYTSKITLTGAEADGILSFSVDFKDRAGNPGNQVTSTTDDSYVNHDILPPEINYVSIASNNPDTSWAKVGDSIFVTFIATEVLDNITVTIAGVSTGYDNPSTAKYRGLYVMSEDDNEGAITLYISYTDLGGAPGPDADTTTNETEVLFDRTTPDFSLTEMNTNNVYGDTLAGIGSTDTLRFQISEEYRDLNITLAGSEKIPSQDGLSFTAAHTFIGNEDEGWVQFSISMTDLAGNESVELTDTQNGSRVRFDGTAPELPWVNFYSNNINDSTLCISGDSLYLHYTISETLRTGVITIAGNSPDISDTSDGVFKSVYGMTGDEDEGFIPFSIGFEDWVGNPGDTVLVSTNGSSVLFDMTPPDDFTLGEILPKTGIEVSGYWNASNQYLEVNIPIPNDATLANGGIQLQSSPDIIFYFSNIADATMIDESDLGTGKRISVFREDFEVSLGYSEGENITFNAIMWDKAGNSTNGSESESIIHIDEIPPTLDSVSHKSNNSIADSLAKVADTDTLTFFANEGLDSLKIQVLGQDASVFGSNREWQATYEFQDSDMDGTVTFNILYGDTAGNLGVEVLASTDGSWVRFDGTLPTLTDVSFISTNNLDRDMAMVGDTLYLDFISDEDLLTRDVIIAGNIADTTFENQNYRTPFRAWRIMDGTENEGYIPFKIGFSDWVGNVGDTVEATTDETSILFDMTPPADFELDTVFVSGGNIVLGYWNSTNDSVTLKVPVPADDETLIGGIFQPQVRFGDSSFINLGDEISITGGLSIGNMELKITRSEFVAMDGFDEGENARFTAIARDKAGNETIGTSDNSILHIDETVPELTSVNIYSNNELDTTLVKVSDNITLTYMGSEGLFSPVGIMILDTLEFTATYAGTNWDGIRAMVQGDPEGIIPFYITYRDTAGNEGILVSETTNGSSVLFDKTNPLISNLIEGSEGEDIAYYNIADSITLYWEQGDALTGNRDAFVALGTDSQSTDIVDWTLSTIDPFSGLGGLSLENDGIYYGSVFVRDSAGNHSDTIWGNSVYIDIENPDTGSVVDGYWIMDLDYIIDSTRLRYIWKDFSDNSEIDYFEIAIGTGSDTTNIMDWMQTDSSDSITVTGLSLVRDILYFTYIRAVDLATNTSYSARTDGVYFDDIFPMVNIISPNFVSDSAGFLSVLDNDTITIKFNKPIYTYDLSVNSNVETDFITSHEYGDSIITIIWTDTLSSYDTLMVVVDSAVAYNTLWVTDTLHFYSKLWGDLNNDYDITVEDILAFNQNWPNTDLGPFNDFPPHVRPAPDGEADLKDLSAFSKMWNWKYFNLDFDSTLFAARSANGLNIFAQGTKVKIIIPENTAMAEVLIGESNLDFNKIKMIKPSSSVFMFTVLDTIQKLIQFSMADFRGLDTLLTLVIPETDQEYFQAQIQYSYMDKDGIVLGRGISSINIDILPDKFSVYDNYPNPFNPITTIKYDLPDTRNVNIIIYDLLGRTIRHLDLKKVEAGRHKYKWYGTNDFGKQVSTGIYFLQITAGQDTQIQKMLLLK